MLILIALSPSAPRATKSDTARTTSCSPKPTPSPNKKSKSKLADNFHCNITNFCHNDAYSGSKPIDRLVLKLLLIDVEEASIFWGLTKKEAEFLIKEINVENYNFVKEWLISLE